MAEKKKMHGCLLGLLVFLGLVVVAVLIIVGVIFFKGDDIVQDFLGQAKVGVSYLLTEDHTDEEKDTFAQAFSLVIDDVSALGLRDGLQKYRDAIIDFQAMIEDQRINRDESAQWLEKHAQ